MANIVLVICLSIDKAIPDKLRSLGIDDFDFNDTHYLCSRDTFNHLVSIRYRFISSPLEFLLYQKCIYTHLLHSTTGVPPFVRSFDLIRPTSVQDISDSATVTYHLSSFGYYRI